MIWLVLVQKAKDSDKDVFDKGVVFYMRDNVVVGIILWNVFNKMNTARKVLEARKPIDNTKQLARLFDVHE